MPGSWAEARRTVQRAARFLPVLAVVVAVNVLVDPGQLFRRAAREEGVARALLAGTTVPAAGLRDRLLQVHYAAALHAPVDILVLGSSRTKEVRSTFVPGRRLYNASVMACTTEDAIAIAGRHVAAGVPPRSVLLGLDPWAFQDESWSHWRQVEDEFHDACTLLGITCPPRDGPTQWSWWTRSPLWELVSPAYFQESLATAWSRGRAGRVPWDPAVQGEGAATTLLPDGSHVRPHLEARSAAAARALARRLGAQPVAALRLTTIEPARASLLDSFVSALRRRGTTVTVLLVPFHPEAWRGVTAAFPANAAVEPFVRAWAKARGLAVLGSYDAAQAGCGPDEFYDGMHAREGCVRRILEGFR